MWGPLGPGKGKGKTGEEVRQPRFARRVVCGHWRGSVRVVVKAVMVQGDPLAEGVYLVTPLCFSIGVSCFSGTGDFC